MAKPNKPITPEDETPGPWNYTTVAVPNGTKFHLYLTDSNGRKIGVLWGKSREKLANAAFILEARNK